MDLIALWITFSAGFFAIFSSMSYPVSAISYMSCSVSVIFSSMSCTESAISSSVSYVCSYSYTGLACTVLASAVAHILYNCTAVAHICVVQLYSCMASLYIWGDFLSHNILLLQHDKIGIYYLPKSVLEKFCTTNVDIFSKYTFCSNRIWRFQISP